ncbi:MAG TPA: TIR domain-containing protein [Ktedonobacteraceae bacterium]
MVEEPRINQDSRKDFYISYKSADLVWADWICWQLEQAEYSIELPSWEFRLSFDFQQEMKTGAEQAKRIIVILSPGYLKEFTNRPEWTEVYERILKDQPGTLISVLVHPCELRGVFASTKHINFIEQDEYGAHNKLLGDIVATSVGEMQIASVIFPQGILQPRRLAQAPRFPRTYPPVGNVPFESSMFLGREQDLEHLYEALSTTGRPQAICGLGGIGKTQIAIAYANRYYHFYRKVIWVNAGSRDTIIEGFINEFGEELQQAGDAVRNIKHWLATNDHWLLILDNANDIKVIGEFIPNKLKGHILLTTRAQTLGAFAQSIEINKLNQDEGALLLLRRAWNSSLERSAISATDFNAAKEIAQIMDGLPLALDQAGAYIDNVNCKVFECLDHCHKKLIMILSKRGDPIIDHPNPVATTWTSDFMRVRKDNLAASEMLRFCALLDPDEIPLEIITEGAPELGPDLQPVAADPIELNNAIGELRKYSFINRHSNSDIDMLSIHRLVQFILKNDMDQGTRCVWAERTVRTLHRTFPAVSKTTKVRCQRYFPHVRSCAQLIDECGLAFEEAVRLLYHLSYFLHEQTDYNIAEKHYQRALALCEQIFGTTSANAANIRGLHALWPPRQKNKVKDSNVSSKATSSHPTYALISDLKPIDIFFANASVDEKHRIEILKHLRQLERIGLISQWREMNPGTETEKETRRLVSRSHIILLLISADFLAADECYKIAIQAKKRHNAGKARVIQILLRPVDWESTPFSDLPFLPSNKKPITNWLDLDEAFTNICQDIKLEIESWHIRA